MVVTDRSNQVHSGPGESAVAHPVRFWWLKRLSVACVLIAATLAGLRVWWGREAERRTQALLGPAIARGELVWPEDFRSPGLADAANAAWYHRLAADSVDPDADCPASSSVYFPDPPPFGPVWDQMAAASVAANPKVYRLMREARAYDAFDWDAGEKAPTVARAMPHLDKARHLANTVGDAALYAHFQGDDAAALETVRDLRHLARSVGSGPNIVSHLVGIGIEQSCQYRVQIIATELELAPEGVGPPGQGAGAGVAVATTRPTRRPAARAQVRALIAELLDERDAAAGLRRAAAGERAVRLETGDWLGDAAPLLRPMFRLDALRLAPSDAVVIEATSEPSWPRAMAAMAAADPALFVVPPEARSADMFAPPATRLTKRQPVDYTWLVSATLPSGIGLSRSIEQSFRARLERRFNAVALATRLYRADHGDWPPTLEALVPKYLPAVPRDPLAKDGGPLRYMLARGVLPGGGDRPVVYGTGVNGVDDTPVATVLPKAPCYSWDRTVDQWRDLSLWQPPPPATTTQPASAQ